MNPELRDRLAKLNYDTSYSGYYRKDWSQLPSTLRHRWYDAVDALWAEFEQEQQWRTHDAGRVAA